MVIGRGLVLLIVEQLPQGAFLLRAALEHQQHPLHRQVSGCNTLIKLRTSQPMSVPLQHRELGFVHWLDDARQYHAWLIECFLGWSKGAK